MENCVTCDTPEPSTPVSTGGCQCVQNPQGVQRETRLLAPTRHEYSEWHDRDPLVPEGVLCLVKDRLFEGSLEYFIGDGTHTFNELITYAGAPLSRTGAQNHSPLAADGKSTLDPSWLPVATSSAYGAVKTSTTGATGKVPIANSNGKLDSSWLPDLPTMSTTKAANAGVQADANGGLVGWKDAIGGALDGEEVGCIAAKAKQLNTSRTFLTNLNSTTAEPFNGTANNVHGITGTLPVSNGGTGATDLANVTVGAAGKAAKLDPGATITVTMSVDGTTHSDTETFTGESNITLDLGSITTSGGGGGGSTPDLSGYMKKFQSASGVGQLVVLNGLQFNDDPSQQAFPTGTWAYWALAYSESNGQGDGSWTAISGIASSGTTLASLVTGTATDLHGWAVRIA